MKLIFPFSIANSPSQIITNKFVKVVHHNAEMQHFILAIDNILIERNEITNEEIKYFKCR